MTGANASVIRRDRSARWCTGEGLPYLRWVIGEHIVERGERAGSSRYLSVLSPQDHPHPALPTSLQLGHQERSPVRNSRRSSLLWGLRSGSNVRRHGPVYPHDVAAYGNEDFVELLAALKRYADEDMDQWELLQFSSKFGSIFVSISRELPPDHPSQAYRDVTELLDEA